MELDNDLLTLWLKARDGLPCDEARDLVERLQTARNDATMAEHEISRRVDAAVEAVIDGVQSRSYEEGLADGRAGA